ncbi:MAG: acetylglutamate kinase [Actinomycetota bacterium]|nr:acetylglutamate kinase [Actinomycetota bacterium]
MEFDKENEKNTDKGDENINYTGKVEVLLESLPYIKEYFNKVVVVKIGGSTMESDAVLQSVINDLILMKYVGIKVVLVHGGGKQISVLSEERGIKPEFVDGLRITDKDSIEIAKMVLIGDINTKIVSFLNKHDEIAIGVSGNDAGFIKCSKKIYKKDGRDIDLGFVGKIESINSKFLVNILDDDYMPVIATLGSDDEGNVYNINADTCAAEIAVSLSAKKMILLTDVDGIMKDNEKEKNLISRLNIDECNKLINTKKISSGMIPKVKACINALENGAEKTHILNGVKKHSILLEIFTDKGIGTMITG